MQQDDKPTKPQAAENTAENTTTPEEDREKLKEGNKAFPGSSTFGGSGAKDAGAQKDHAPAGYKSPNLGSSSVVMDQDEAAAMKNKESGTSDKK